MEFDENHLTRKIIFGYQCGTNPYTGVQGSIYPPSPKAMGGGDCGDHKQ